MPSRHFILATAGHVDHGKSALVKALTGTDPDRLPEEKARGITIDLGFAHLVLPAPDAAEPFSIGIVDVPGHEDFVKNMVAGVGSIDLALFIVATDDGWMPQSEEHLQILNYLGVGRAVVALTKIDLAPDREAEAIAALRAHLQNTPFAEAPIVPTSVTTNRGLDELKSALASALAATAPAPDLAKPRLPVDRVFSLKGIGTIVTGTLTGGSLQIGQAVVLQPGGATSRVRSLQSYNADAESCGPGTRTAVNLPDVEPRSENQPNGVARGDVLTLAGLGDASDTLDARLEKSPRLLGTNSPAARPLKDRTRVRVHFGSSDCAATVFLHNGGELTAGASRLAQIRFEEPVFVFAGDRFIVRDWSEQATLAGGLVLDADGDRKHWQHKSQRALLEARAAAPEDITVWVASEVERDGVVRQAELLRKSRFSTAQITEAVARRAAAGRLVIAGGFAAESAHWQALLAKAAQAVEQAHRMHPERLGLSLAELRAALADDLRIPEVFDALLAALARQDFVPSGTVLRRAAHRPALPPRLQAVGDWLRSALAEKPFEPPSRKDLVSDALSQQALKFLLETGEAVELGPDQVMAAGPYAQAVERIKAHLRQRGPATVSDLRQVVGATRRIMVPLLERLDREGITRRQGDLRTLGSAAE